MYDAGVTQKQIERVERAMNVRLKRHDAGRIADWTASLSAIAASPKPRRWTAEEAAFIRNEQILCQLDWNHWAANYCSIMLGGINQSGLGKLELWESQRMLMRLVCECERTSFDAAERKEPADGILIAYHKARQLGATAICRSFLVHRISLWKSIAGFSASVDDDKILELYDRDKRIYDNLPFFLKPSLDSRDGSIDQQAMYVKFGKLDSGILYQTDAQKSGLGQGRKFDVSHITEAASFEAFGALTHDFFPGMPQGMHVLCVAESTAQGRGNPWHVWTEAIRKRKVVRWRYIFVPVYVNSARNRRTPPLDWVPSAHTTAQAAKIEATSAEYMGRVFVPERDFLYWWESTRNEYAEMGKLNQFYTNFPSTVEESFQFVTGGAFHPELLERIGMDVVEPVSYEFERAAVN